MFKTVITLTQMGLPHITLDTVALVYQSCLEMCVDLRAGVKVRKDLSVIHENSVYGQSQRMNQRVLINAAAETDHC